MENHSVAIKIKNLKVGMCVVSLDRPWLETPFLLQGFSITDENQIEELDRYCKYVYIEKDTVPTDYIVARTTIKPEIKVKKLDEILPQKKTGRYEDKISIKDEMESAKIVQHDLESTVSNLYDTLQSGNEIQVAHIKSSVNPMIDSVIRNPDAMIWLARLKQKDNYTYRHAIGSSIWATALGRQLGLPKSDLRLLAVGSLLCDIGKANVPQELLTKPSRLSEKEFVEIRKHVQYGLDLLKRSKGVHDQIFSIVAYHHERHQGQGYPKGFSGDQIPVFARIAAIADCYDAITSHRYYAKALSSSLAVKKLYEWRDVEFQAELVEEFIQAIGIYPAGTLVELSNKEVAVVIAEGRRRRLKPTVMCLLDKHKKTKREMSVIDLMQHEIDHGESLCIDHALEPGAHGIDPEELYL